MNLEDTYLNMLLEKDHRQNMQKFGIPEDVANFLHEFNDKYSLWFANQLKTMPDYQKATNKVAWIRGNLMFYMQQIVDWVSNVPNTFLKTYNWDSAVKASDEWHKGLQTNSIEGKETHPILKKYDDGYYWADLESNRCPEERDAMGHCATSNKADTLYSLRHYDPNTDQLTSHITAAVSPNEGTWYQIKGRNNSKPSPKYVPYIVDILVTKKIFTQESEYDTSHDFSVSDFKNYLEKNPDKYENTDEIIDKLNESGLEMKAEKLASQYTFKKVGMDWNIEGDGDIEYISAYGGGSFALDEEDFPELEYLEKWDEHDQETNKDKWNRPERNLADIIKDILEKHDLAITQDDAYTGDFYEFRTDTETGERKLWINIHIDGHAEGSYGDELDIFHSFLSSLSDVDDKLSDENFESEFADDLREELIERGILMEPQEDPADYEKYQRKMRNLTSYKDPNQLKFPYAESYRVGMNFKTYFRLKPT